MKLNQNEYQTGGGVGWEETGEADDLRGSSGHLVGTA